MSLQALEVACCFDGEMYVAACALISSIVETRRANRSLVIHVITDSTFTPDLSIASKDAIDIRLHRVDSTDFDDPDHEFLTRATYFRILLPRVLSQCSRVIYLDCDVVVLKPLDDLFDLYLGRSALAAMPDYFLQHQTRASGVPHGEHSISASYYAKRLAGTTLEKYFNTGVMLINLDVWREEKLTDLMLARVKCWPNTRFADQDAINAVVTDYTEIDCRWNVFASAERHASVADGDDRWGQVLDLWKTDPWIVHFAGAEKPWLPGPGTSYDHHFRRQIKAFPEALRQTGANAVARPSGAPTLPLVTVVIVNFNYGRYLRQSVESVLYQNYPAIECIVVDNASSDESRHVLDQIQRVFPDDVIVHRANHNLGQGGASKRGSDLSKGNYILFLDADDYLLPNCLKTLIYAHLAAPSAVGFTSGDMLQIQNDRVVVGSAFEAAYERRDSCCKLLPVERMKDVGKISRASALFFADIERRDINLFQVNESNIDWIWSPTSGNLYRADAVKLFIGAKAVESFKINFDAFLNLGINSFVGSILVDRPVACYRVHGENSFAQRAAMRNFINYRRNTDFGSFAALCVLAHVEANFDVFSDNMLSLHHLRHALVTLEKKAAQHPRQWQRLRTILLYVRRLLLRSRIKTLVRLHETSGDPTAIMRVEEDHLTRP